MLQICPDGQFIIQGKLGMKQLRLSLEQQNYSNHHRSDKTLCVSVHVRMCEWVQQLPLQALIICSTISAAPRLCRRDCWYRSLCFSISFSCGAEQEGHSCNPVNKGCTAPRTHSLTHTHKQTNILLLCPNYDHQLAAPNTNPNKA